MPDHCVGSCEILFSVSPFTPFVVDCHLGLYMMHLHPRYVLSRASVLLSGTGVQEGGQLMHQACEHKGFSKRGNLDD